MLFLILASLSATAPLHSAPLAHAEGTLNAEYHLAWSTQTRDVELGPPTKSTPPVCHWRATPQLTRAVRSADGATLDALSKSVQAFAPVRGTLVGRCAQVQPQIDAAIARAGEKLALQAQQRAATDHAALGTALNQARN